MLEDFHLYDLFILGFVQLVITTALVFSPLRNIDQRLRWSRTRIGEIVMGAIGVAIVGIVSCQLATWAWNLNSKGVQLAAFVIGLFSFIVVVARPNCSVVGKLFSASYAAAGFTFLGYAAYVASHATRSIAETMTATLLIVLNIGAFLVWSSNINYVTDVMCRSRRGRPFPIADPNYQPFVSIHIPAYNEPPDILIETIKRVEEQDYPNYEIIVIDNNTADPEVWRPVEEYCRGREKVKFIHVAPWPGYKAGACNLVLREYTDPRAEIIGLVDADDFVKPYYLSETVPYFCDESIGFVQTFEGNREFEGSAYYQACVDSYQGFYLAVMSSRNERDTVPFVGTMGLFRRSALEGVGGWNEWCICEDTEASLRVLKAGWSGLYIPRCFGRGVVPPTYGGLNTQRHRWCFGGMQILRLHWRSLMPWDRSPDNHLTPAQRRDYLMGSLCWVRDLLMAAFSILLLVVTGLLLTEADFALMPLGGEAALLPMSLILVATICMTWTLRWWTAMSRWRALKGLLISLSASWITAVGCIQGLTAKEGVFLRTSKKGSDKHPIRRAIRLSLVETILAVCLYAGAISLAFLDDRPLLLILIMFVQATVYVCSPVAAIWNVFAQRLSSAEYRRRHEARQAKRARRRPIPAFATPAFFWMLLLAVIAATVVATALSPNDLAPVPAPTIGPVPAAAPTGG